MKFAIVLFTVFISTSAFADQFRVVGSESSRKEIITGKVIRLACADANIGLLTRSGEKICLGFGGDFKESDLVVGNRYTLGGELTADGFYPNEFLD